MDSAKIKERLERKRTETIAAGQVAQTQLIEAEEHVQKLKICMHQLQGQMAVYDNLLADESLFSEETENAIDIDEVINAKA